MYKGNKEREARMNQEIKNAEMSQKNLDLKNENMTNLKLYDISEKNGFQNLAFEIDDHAKK